MQCMDARKSLKSKGIHERPIQKAMQCPSRQRIRRRAPRPSSAFRKKQTSKWPPNSRSSRYVTHRQKTITAQTHSTIKPRAPKHQDPPRNATRQSGPKTEYGIEAGDEGSQRGSIQTSRPDATGRTRENGRPSTQATASNRREVHAATAEEKRRP